MILDLFSELPFSSWMPCEDKLTLLYEWLVCSEHDNLLNCVSRLIFSRLNWNLYDDSQCLQLHRQLAVKIYESVNNNLTNELKSLPHCNSKQYGLDNILKLAKSNSITDFIKWSWLTLVSLKVHVLDQSNFDWNLIFCDKLFGFPQSFIPVPNVLDSNLVPICRGLEDKNRIAIFVSLMMSDIGHS